MNNGVRLDLRQEKGTVVVAAGDFAKGNLITSAFATILDKVQVRKIKGLDIYKFVFFDPQTSLALVVFGDVSWCSHSNNPNASVTFSPTECPSRYLVELTAERAIADGEEVTMKYSNVEEYPDHKSWNT